MLTLLSGDIFFNGGLIIVLLSLNYFKMLTISNYFYYSLIPLSVSIFVLIKYYPMRKIQSKSLIAFNQKIFTFASPLIGFSVMQFISGHIFVYMSAILLGASSVGAIRATGNIVALLIVLYMAIDNYLPKKMMQLYESSFDELKNYTIKFMTIGSVFIIFISIGIVLFATDLVRILYGHEYVEYAYLIYWFLLISLFQFLIRPLSIYLKTLEKTHIFTRTGLVVLFWTTVLTFPLIHYLELNGAMLVALLQQILIFTILFKHSQLVTIKADIQVTKNKGNK